MRKLTDLQKSLLMREPTTGNFEPFIMLQSGVDDRVAKNLAKKGLGNFVNNGMRYSWRKRDGYTNNFEPNAEGWKLIKELKSE